MSEQPRKVLYIDMDNTLVDFSARLDMLDPVVQQNHPDDPDEIPGFFALIPPVQGALDAFTELSRLFDIYILSTAPWGNPSAWQHKVEWVHLHFGKHEDSPAYKRLILSHHKNLNKGDFLVDDRPYKGGADEFEGEVIHFGSKKYPDWPTVVEHLRPLA